jgi:hypothetical protein
MHEATESDDELKDDLVKRVKVRTYKEPWPEQLLVSPIAGAMFTEMVRATFGEAGIPHPTVYIFGRLNPITNAVGRFVFIVEPSLSSPDDTRTSMAHEVITRGIVKACRPAATMLVTECWFKLGAMTERDVERMVRQGVRLEPGRQEGVFVALETHETRIEYMAPIIRMGGGVRVLGAFGLMRQGAEMTAKGRLANLMRGRAQA